MNSGYTYRDVVKERFAGIRILDFYIARYPKHGRDEWLSRFAREQIRLNDQVASPDTVLRAGDRLAYVRPPWEEPSAPTDLPVIFEDDDFLAVNKPAGLPVLPGGGFLENTVIRLLRCCSTNWRSISPVHCLDRGTSGLLLLGKNREALSRLGRALQKRRITRLYLAVLEGLVAADRFTIEAPIDLANHPRLGPIQAAGSGGKPSRTDFRVLDRDETTHTTLVQLAPHTGRTHQLRIHAAVAGHPLAGEPFYVAGGRWDEQAAMRADRIPLPGDCGYRLHAWQLVFAHPRDGSPIQLSWSPPAGFWEKPV